MHHQAQSCDHALGLLALWQAGLEQRLTGVLHEQVDGTLGDGLGGVQLHRGDAHELLHGEAATKQAQQHAHSADVGLGVPPLASRATRPQHARRLQRPQHGGRDPGALGQFGERQALLGELGHRRRFFGLLGPALDGARVAPLLEVADEPEPLEMAFAVPGNAPFVARSWQQALGLIGPQELNGDARQVSHFLHPVRLHAVLLSSLNCYTG